MAGNLSPGNFGLLQHNLPKPDSCTGASDCGQLQRLLDHLVGAGEQRRRDFEAERPRGLEINDELELGWLLDRQVGRALALEDAVDIEGGAGPRSACLPVT